jgi:hypothetical protein
VFRHFVMIHLWLRYHCMQTHAPWSERWISFLMLSLSHTLSHAHTHSLSFPPPTWVSHALSLSSSSYAGKMLPISVCVAT